MMDIVDGQVHVGLGGVEPTLAAMNALGINTVLIDEYWGRSATGEASHTQPGYLLANAAWRPATGVAEQAALLYPERFSYVVRVERKDPELESLLRVIRTAPNARAIRVLAVRSDADADAFGAGAYDQLFELAQGLGLPVFVFIPGQVELLHASASKFPELTFVVDHCGMPAGGYAPTTPKNEAQTAGGARYFEEVLKLAAYPNVALKWCHAHEMFSVPDYPYLALRPLLRRAIEAFGVQRLIWASDHSVVPTASWADLLFSVRDDPELTQTEKEWLLGRSLRTLLKWPARAEPAAC